MEGILKWSRTSLVTVIALVTNSSDVFDLWYMWLVVIILNDDVQSRRFDFHIAACFDSFRCNPRE